MSSITQKDSGQNDLQIPQYSFFDALPRICILRTLRTEEGTHHRFVRKNMILQMGA